MTISNLLGRSGTTRIKFEAGTNIIYGRNGKGKTTILDLVASSFSNDTQHIKEVEFSECRVRIDAPEYRTELTKSISRKVIYSSAAEDIDFYSQFPEMDFDYLGEHDDLVDENLFIWKNLDSSSSSLPLDVTYLRIDRLHKFEKTISGDESETFGKNIKNLWTIYNNRLLSQIQEKQEGFIVDLIVGDGPPSYMSEHQRRHGYLQLMRFVSDRPKFKLRDFEISYEEFSRRYADEPGFKRIVDEISGLQEFSDNINQPRNALQNILSDLLSEEISVRYFRNNIHFYSQSNKRIYLDRLSSGEKHVLFILINIANAGNGLVIIDEPELSMHVSWQNKLLDAMTSINPEAQIVMATHSPEIVSSNKNTNFIKI
ncbi:AAA family ATPase [Deinococcus puniceus]|uniref:AAA family ATPase n=1 Tax=Deinococcus puniceus TaxID=1182568 RepID=UPI0018D2CA35|nr:AAA family ATPase [Deinococcus puniceus]